MTSSVYLHFYEKLAQNAKVLNLNDVLPEQKNALLKEYLKAHC
jgi:hypothetical protein